MLRNMVLMKQIFVYQGTDRQKYYEKLKHFKTFGRGWTRRVNETTEIALKLI